MVLVRQNDLGMCKEVDLMLRAKRDLGILELFPGVKVMLQWQGAMKSLKATKLVGM